MLVAVGELYRNRSGALLRITGRVVSGDEYGADSSDVFLPVDPLRGSNIYVAECLTTVVRSRSLVTADGLKTCGFELVGEERTSGES
ncbi:hypothetical protein [Bifidobacterium callitrichidarum]|uniref:hypothetical protein n=1 Tax=Bifidobacterium callitrichidarum TaxID=2052941 RepID=UPI0011B20C51|nr:hypothetical protein [Bifidobacterium callitrichidarum]